MTEDFGHSEIAARFGLKQYPAVFVDDVLVAQPRDFTNFFGDQDGKYLPFDSKPKRQAFKADLKRVIDLVLAGKGDQAHKLGETKMAAIVAQTFPTIALQDLGGQRVKPADLAGKAVVVECWATWCPPCKATLRWLEQVRTKYGDKVAILAVACNSAEPEVRKYVAENGIHNRVIMGSPAIASAFSNFASVPQVYIYDGKGKLKDMILGAPPEGHDRIEAAIKACLG